MGTKQNPGQYDCYAKAAPDEPMFVLLARDPDAPFHVADWASRREHAIDIGERPETDRAKVKEARECAEAMRRWRRNHRPPTGKEGDAPESVEPAWRAGERKPIALAAGQPAQPTYTYARELVLAERLRRAMTTASNDDRSGPMTEKRLRHSERLTTMSEAADALEAQLARIAELEKERDALADHNAKLQADLSAFIAREAKLSAPAGDEEVEGLIDLADQIDGQLDDETYEQSRREAGAPDDAEWTVTAGLCRKIDKLIIGVLGLRRTLRRLKSQDDGGRTRAAIDVLAERKRQIVEKGYDAEHDDRHINGEILLAEWGARRRLAKVEMVLRKSVAEHRNLLVEAAALILAEIERLDRLSGSQPKEAGNDGR